MSGAEITARFSFGLSSTMLEFYNVTFGCTLLAPHEEGGGGGSFIQQN